MFHKTGGVLEMLLGIDLWMNLGMNLGNEFRGFKEKIIMIEYRIGIKLMGFDDDLQELL